MTTVNRGDSVLPFRQFVRREATSTLDTQETDLVIKQELQYMTEGA